LESDVGTNYFCEKPLTLPTGCVEFGLVVGFHEVAAMVSINRGLHDGDAFNTCLDEIELSHN
ncbi:MAG: hypothetical protein MJZ76_10815, partial [Bacteroidales bacterium]|nr:hypothetical protein [Bacteroidales bacterium]